jgi:Rha family phage regulatory protein
MGTRSVRTPAPRPATVSISKTLAVCTKLGVSIHDREVRVSSRDVAREFGKRHDNVLRDIDNLIKKRPELGALSFEATGYVDDAGKQNRSFLMNRAGFSLLAMRFTGDKALDFQIAYIAAFDAMEAELKKADAQRAVARSEGKLIRRAETDTIKLLVEHAKAQGSSHADWYYANVTLMTYRALGIERPSVDGVRDTLDVMTLNALATAEQIVSQAIRDGLKAGLFYKSIFELCKERVAMLAVLLRPKLEAAP